MTPARKSVVIYSTLLFYIFMLVYHPAFAQLISTQETNTRDHIANQNIPVHFVSESEINSIIDQYEKLGFKVKEGTYAQLEKIAEASNPIALDNKPNIIEIDNTQLQQTNQPTEEEEKLKQTCKKMYETLQTTPQESDNLTLLAETKYEFESKCGKYQEEIAKEYRERVKPQESKTRVSTGIHVDLSHGTSSSGGNSDAAKVFFIFVGVVMVAALFVYAGKYIADMIGNKEQEYWWEIGFNSMFMSTNSGQHGRFYGVKLATGFVSNDLVQLALLGEIGKLDLDLILDESTPNSELELTGSYWMAGATVRMHLSDKLVNPSYMYVEMLGGGTDHSATDLIANARGGINFGIQDSMRLGFSIGTQYLGIDEEQGISDNDDNFWFTYGLEFGVRF